jgi:DNA-binding CsgD family transcriptional regulator
MGRSSEELLVTVEMMLFAATGYVASAEAGPSEFMGAVCDIFDADGCIITRPSPSRAASEENILLYLRTGQYPTRQTRQMLIRPFQRDHSFVLTNPKSQGGPAILALASEHRMLLYRSNQFKTFSDEDAQLTAALWRSCTASKKIAPSRSIPKDIDPQRLSPRVRQVLQYILQGFAEKQIAHHLGISGHTVHVYVKNLYRQVGVSSRSELILHFLHTQVESRDSKPSIVRDVAEAMRAEIEQSQIEPPDEIIASSSPVPPIDRSGANMKLCKRKPTCQSDNPLLLPVQ